jgi:endonuclease III
MKPNVAEQIFAYLDHHYPHAGCELWYRKDYELLIAVVLSAQTTDKAVNGVTPQLFASFPTLNQLASAPITKIEKLIQSIGLYRTKAKHIKEIANVLLTKYQGKVPEDKAELTSLPGVGIKTANVVRAEIFKIPEIAVDTHVHRLAYRLGFTRKADQVAITEKKLRQAMPESRYIRTHHQLIHFGRYACKAKRPACNNCGLVNICKEPNKNLEK